MESLIPVSFFFLVTIITSASSSPPSSVDSHLGNIASHPLDPLTFSEISVARSILISHPPFSHPNPFPSIHSLSLLEPPKSSVLSWIPASPLPSRRASVTAYSPNITHLLTLDISSRSVLSHSTIPHPSAFPRITLTDFSLAASVAIADPRVVRAAIARGLDPSRLSCFPLSPGWFGPEEEGRRLAKIQCFALSPSTANFYMRPLEGLTALVDIDAGAVLWVRDEGLQIPVPSGDGTDYRFTGRRAGSGGAGMEMTGGGRGFVVEGGHTVKWGRWELHLKADERAGMVVSTARVRDDYDEGQRWRSVMYKGMSSELFVPYMDGSQGWYYRGYMDAGEYGLGTCALPLVRLNDCPRNAYYMDAVFVREDGEPYVRRDVICLFERYAGDVAWRHSELFSHEDVMHMSHSSQESGLNCKATAPPNSAENPCPLTEGA
ncbi:Primary amine oxidase [Platanthera guangdongensis]|uniref:Amine oxidase n=1 Tax=Platanthera guangdongensis TaxID=2320717 RepID=A0ABR2LN95_9ASPA